MGEELPHPRRIIEKIRAYTDMIILHTFRLKNSNRCESNDANTTWTPPPEGSAMLIVDATIFSQSRRMGAGYILRDHGGKVLLAGSCLLGHGADLELAEAIAMRCAISAILEHTTQYCHRV
ncbi:hypothetical protein VPH35_004751 [Triticum aestivum]